MCHVTCVCIAYSFIYLSIYVCVVCIADVNCFYVSVNFLSYLYIFGMELISLCVSIYINLL